MSREKWGGGISALESKETDQLYDITVQLICVFVLHIQTGFSLDTAKVKKYQCTVVPTKSDSDVILCLQLLSKTSKCTLYLS